MSNEVWPDQANISENGENVLQNKDVVLPFFIILFSVPWILPVDSSNDWFVVVAVLWIISFVALPLLTIAETWVIFKIFRSAKKSKKVRIQPHLVAIFSLAIAICSILFRKLVL